MLISVPSKTRRDEKSLPHDPVHIGIVRWIDGAQDTVPDFVCIFRGNGFNFEHDVPPLKPIFIS